MDTSDYPIPLSMLNALAYCPRRFYLEHVEGVFVSNADVEDGRNRHRRVDKKDSAGKIFKEGTFYRARSVYLGSQTYGIAGVIDLVEEKEGCISPVEYKRGEAPKDESGSAFTWENDKVQLCAQALLLEQNLKIPIKKGILYYIGSKEKTEVLFDKEIRDKTQLFINKARELSEPAAAIPPPLEDDGRCHGCSLRPVCLPEEIYYLKNKPSAVQKIIAHVDEGSVLYLQEQGSWVTKRGAHLIVHRNGGSDKTTVPFANLKQVVVFGNVQLTTQAVEALLEEGIPAVFLSVYGRLKGTLSPAQTKSPNIRLAQYAATRSPEFKLNISRETISAKISNCRVLLMRSLRSSAEDDFAATEDDAVEKLKQFIRLAESAKSAEELLGVEGLAAKVYFHNFVRMLKTPEKYSFDFNGRNRRPPKDPVNALLSFGYTLLLKDAISAAGTAGLDPCIGFYHTARRSQPALALDLMEEFRPIVADSVVLTVLNKSIIALKDFMRFGEACYLNESGRKKFFEAYEERKNTEVIHPVFGYKVTYSRTLEVQARMLAAVLRGDIPKYTGFIVR